MVNLQSLLIGQHAKHAFESELQATWETPFPSAFQLNESQLTPDDERVRPLIGWVEQRLEIESCLLPSALL